MNIGIIGTGAVGSPLAKNLAAAGHQVKVTNTRQFAEAQLWHVGRMSHPDMLNGKLPLAPSAINPNEKVYTPTGFLDTPTPVAMTVEQIKKTVEDFLQAAQNALDAGFDGVEVALGRAVPGLI
jgi:2,4-dienoyl-CoA reductase-like NADH-dependent reductase (Old Yellow Enzyme family)